MQFEGRHQVYLDSQSHRLDLVKELRSLVAKQQPEGEFPELGGDGQRFETFMAAQCIVKESSGNVALPMSICEVQQKLEWAIKSDQIAASMLNQSREESDIASKKVISSAAILGAKKQYVAGIQTQIVVVDQQLAHMQEGGASSFYPMPLIGSPNGSEGTDVFDEWKTDVVEGILKSRVASLVNDTGPKMQNELTTQNQCSNLGEATTHLQKEKHGQQLDSSLESPPTNLTIPPNNQQSAEFKIHIPTLVKPSTTTVLDLRKAFDESVLPQGEQIQSKRVLQQRVRPPQMEVCGAHAETLLDEESEESEELFQPGLVHYPPRPILGREARHAGDMGFSSSETSDSKEQDYMPDQLPVTKEEKMVESAVIQEKNATGGERRRRNPLSPNPICEKRLTRAADTEVKTVKKARKAKKKSHTVKYFNAFSHS
ncbi:unnamed protein product [Calypogeia fissa]